MSWRDGALLLAVMGLALAARLPYMMLIPRLGDEVYEALQALRIARGESMPLTGVNAMFGPLYAYLLALCFRIFGPSPVVPRALATAATVVSVGLTYLLARHRLRDHVAAAVAAALMAATPTFILVNSHLGYSNSTTPMFTTAMLLALAVAMERHSGPLLVLGGFLAGLSLQTHLSVIPMLAGVVLWFLAQRRGRRWLHEPWPYLAVAAFALAYSPVIWFNLRSGFATLAEPLAHPYAFTGTGEMDLLRYLENLRLLIWEFTWMVSGRMSLDPEPAIFLVLGGLRVLWLVAGLVYAVRRRDGLLFAIALSTAALMPAFNNLYSRTMGTRYIVWLLPLGYIAMAALLPALLRRLHAELSRVVAGTCVLALILFPLVPLGMYYGSHQARQRTNEALLRFARTIKEEAGPGLAAVESHPSTLVVIDEDVDLLYLSNAGTVLSAMDYLLTLQETPHVIVPGDRVIETLGQAEAGLAWLIAEWEAGTRAVEALGMEPVDSGIIGGKPERQIGLFIRQVVDGGW
jgi:4-amino-4-deoxy-L-arabinose transferase-like glycosyltransferase